MKPETRLKHYLECGQILREFFEEVDYCKNHCINQLESLALHGKEGTLVEDIFIPGSVGCCVNRSPTQDPCDYFVGVPTELIHLLREGREHKYGKPTNTERYVVDYGQPCAYHTEEGCLMETHKNPLCVGFVCLSYTRHLEKGFGIQYYSSVIISLLENILSEKATSKKITNHKKKLKGFVTDAKAAKARYGV